MAVTSETVRTAVHQIVGDGERLPPSRRLPYSLQARKALGLSLRESNERGKEGEIATGHILLGILRESGAGLRVLDRLEVDVDELRERVGELLGTRSEVRGIKAFTIDSELGQAEAGKVYGPYQYEFQEHVFESAQELAAEFGGAVHVPTRWPTESSPITYVLASNSELGRSLYKVRPAHGNVPILVGGTGSVHERISRGSEWEPVQELKSANGHLSVQKERVQVTSSETTGCSG